MIDATGISAIAIAILTAITGFFSMLHLKHCRSCGCCESDCIQKAEETPIQNKNNTVN